MEDNETNITYETLFELLRREKGREELQQLDKSFYSDVINYLKEKKEMLGNKDPMFADQGNNVEKQLENAKKIIKELYDKREKKITNLAIYKAKTNSDLIDKSLFLREEKEIFDKLVELLKKSRDDVLLNVINMVKIEKEENKSEEKEEETEEEIVMVRFLDSVSKFVGKELETYGPFEAEDVANLPREIANILINKEKAEEIKQK